MTSASSTRACRNFYPRPPRGGRRTSSAFPLLTATISIHALREEGDKNLAVRHLLLDDFYPRPPRGGRPRRLRRRLLPCHFYPRPPRGGRRSHKRYPCPEQNFYPRPPRGGRRSPIRAMARLKYFYPRPPRGGRQRGSGRGGQNLANFYPRPPRGGRPVLPSPARGEVEISIHALREEGDKEIISKLDRRKKFLSTPSARRATVHLPKADSGQRFLSTPSARRATKAKIMAASILEISIHALREEGDSIILKTSSESILFLSTPSARRATAKTEKNIPAFVSV